jgi:hypothetical protein
VSGPQRSTGPRAGLFLFLALALGGCATTDPAPSTAPGVSCPAPATALPGLQTGSPPWSPALDTLQSRLEAIGAPILRQEGQAVDRHIQVIVSVDGQGVLVPDTIGINGTEIEGGVMSTGIVTEMHTHDRSGLVHIHAVVERPFLLGEFFDVWGVAFGADRIGGACASGDRAVRVFVDGAEASGDPRSVEMTDGSTILVAIGTPDQLPPAGSGG